MGGRGSGGGGRGGGAAGVSDTRQIPMGKLPEELQGAGRARVLTDAMDGKGTVMTLDPRQLKNTQADLGRDYIPSRQSMPNIQWSDFDSLRWSLLGIPLNAPLIAIEGRPRQRKDFSEWSRCAREACDVLQPQCVLLYGATADMAATIPCPVICWTSANPRGRVPVRMRFDTPLCHQA